MSSKHIFMFPFRWDYQPKDRSIDLIDYDKRTNLSVFDRKIAENNKWERKADFSIDTTEDYNSKTYFYPFVRNAILPNNSSGLTKFYEYKLGSNAQYIIQLKDGTRYNLLIENISLCSYDIGVGVLSFHLVTIGNVNQDDILKINDLGRRLFPAFLGNNFDLEVTKTTLLPDMIQLVDAGGLNIATNFSNDYKNAPDYLPDYVLKLLGGSFTTKPQKDKIKLEPVLDDRMFVICWYGNNTLSNRLKNFDQQALQYSELHEDEFWYKFVYVDTTLTCPDILLRKKSIEESSYKRWLPYGTLFGVSRYSFVLLTGEDDFAKNILSGHLSIIYFRMILLSLVQRSALLRFSGEIAYVSRRFSTEKKSFIARSLFNELSGISDQVSKLYRTYIAFNNKIFFKEITTQEQGIELYDLVQNRMRIPETVNEVEEEVEKLHNYLQLLNDANGQTLLDRLGLLGGLFLIPGFIFSYLSLGILDFEKLTIDKNDFLYIRYGLLVLVLLFCLFYALPRIARRAEIKQWGQVITLALMILVMGFLVSTPLRKGYETSKKAASASLVIDSTSVKRLDSIKNELKELNKKIFPKVVNLSSKRSDK